ncbi:DNA glycosylase AlkZ-like family protein [Candidatus Poribacteria bacterium]
MDSATILAERLRRQRLIDPLDEPDEYIELFRLLQPVSPVAMTMPGDPPKLVHRTSFDNGAIADRMREERLMVKGRFLGGGIGYVLTEDLELYANAFCRRLSGLNETQEIVLDAVVRSETLTPRQMKEETGLLNKNIMPALHRLQEAFLVYEDQVDSDWERNWYEFAAEWPEVVLNEDRREEAVTQVLLRFIQGHVFATMEQLKDWSRLPVKLLKSVISNMEESGVIVPKAVEGIGEGWIRDEDADLKPCEAPPSVFMIHRADILAKSHNSELKRKLGGQEVLQYLLIDGAFKGAVLGHWRIGPHDVDDIVVEVPAKERKDRREEILNAVAWGYSPPHSHILRYDGVEVDIK